MLPHPAPLSGASYSAVELQPANDAVVLLDQRRLPAVEEYVLLRDADAVARAIREMVVRGAPAIGIAAAYALALAARTAPREAVGFLAALDAAGAVLRAARPTAVNLAWAVEQMLGAARLLGAVPADERSAALAEAARQIHRDDVAANRYLGRLGAERIPDGATILTHCNAGALATGGYGTALGVVRAARDAGKRVRVLADETRPWLQGSRLTAWELARDGIDVEIVADSAAAWLMARGAVDVVVVGADRIARSGDVANKIGTYGLACHASRHARPFYVAAPWSTVDLACAAGADISIEERASEELTHLGGAAVAAPGISARNPAFDVTPAALVTAIVTERGIVEPVGEAALVVRAKQPA